MCFDYKINKKCNENFETREMRFVGWLRCGEKFQSLYLPSKLGSQSKGVLFIVPKTFIG